MNCGKGLDFSKYSLQVGHRSTDIVRSHERLADQHRSHAGGGHALHVGAILNARLRHQNLLILDKLREAHGVAQIGGECAQVAIVDSQQRV